MKIEATPEEIAALVVALQERRVSAEVVAEEIANRLREAVGGTP